MQSRLPAFVVLLLGLIALAASLPPAAGATAGRLDPKFGKHGTAETRLGPSYEASWFYAVSPRSDGGVSLERNSPSKGFEFQAFGYAPGGPFVPEGVESELKSARVELADGSTVEARSSCCSGWLLVRLLPDGQPDPSFGGNGVVASPIERPKFILPLASGKLLIAGEATWIDPDSPGSKLGPPSTTQVAVARLDADGTVDQTFGKSGSVLLHDELDVSEEKLKGIALREAESLVVGVEQNGAGTLVALTAAGSLDPTFGAGGTAPVASSIAGIAAAAGGATLVAGTSPAGPPACCGWHPRDFALSRITASGDIDPSFGNGGSTVIDLGGEDVVESVLWGADGSILLGGDSRRGTVACRLFGACEQTPALASLSADGRLRSDFGEGGKLLLASLSEPEPLLARNGVLALAERPGGGFYAAGGAGTKAFVGAFGAGGAPIPGFGEDGIAITRYATWGTEEVHDVVTEPGGRILVAATIDAGLGSASGALIRFRRNGALDRGYGRRGFALVPAGAGTVALDRHRRALVLSESPTVRAVTRLLPSGRVDPSFGRDGVAVLRHEFLAGPELRALAVQPNGKVLLAGRIGTRRPRVFVARFRANGSIDRSFGKRGRVLLAPRHHGLGAGARQIRIAPNGRILVLGYVVVPGKIWWADGRMAVVRLRANGSVDRSFGHRGWSVPRVGVDSQATGVAFQGRKLLVAGVKAGKKRTATVLVRVTGRGRLDRSFGRRGRVSRRGTKSNSSLFKETASVMRSGRRIVVVRAGVGSPVLGYSPDGRFLPGYGRNTRIAAQRTERTFFPYGPVVASQSGRPVLAWTAAIPNGRGGLTLTARLQRLLKR